LKEEYYL